MNVHIPVGGESPCRYFGAFHPLLLFPEQQLFGHSFRIRDHSVKSDAVRRIRVQSIGHYVAPPVLPHPAGLCVRPRTLSDNTKKRSPLAGNVCRSSPLYFHISRQIALKARLRQRNEITSANLPAKAGTNFIALSYCLTRRSAPQCIDSAS